MADLGGEVVYLVVGRVVLEAGGLSLSQVPVGKAPATNFPAPGQLVMAEVAELVPPEAEKGNVMEGT